MSMLARRALPTAVTVVTLALWVAGCTSTSPNSPAPSAPAASASTQPSPSASRTGSPQASPSQDANAVTIDITIAGGKVDPSGERVNVAKGQTVILNVTSDSDDEVHVHTAGDGIEIPVKADVPATARFVAADTGSFEVESHHLNKIIVILNVR
ncbi:MAG: uncharacterized protein JWN06_977 [Propionibacteriaceae bacterium]|nr:uncharacterized protein [Propionibacteriaceae bacterium]